MQNITVNFLGNFASIVSLGIGGYLLSQQTPTSPAGWILLGVSGIFVLLLLVKNLFDLISPPVRFLTQFGRYCKLCKHMVNKSPGFVYTIQSPADINLAGSDDPRGYEFKHYIEATIKKLLKVKRTGQDAIGMYRRLIVVKKDTTAAEKEKMRIVLETLKQQLTNFFSKHGNGSRRRVIPALKNMEIGVIHADIVAEWFFSNVDIHITSNTRFVIAFQEKDQHGGMQHLRASIHVNDRRADNARSELQKIYADKLWPVADNKRARHGNRGYVICPAEFLERVTWENWNTNLDVCINTLQVRIETLIDQVGNS